jgi:hypothetical protein
MRATGWVACFLIAMSVADAFAEDWDHDANIEAAVGVLVSAYRQDGMAGLEKLVSGCYGYVDDAGDTDAQLRQLETCATMDFAAWRVDRVKAPAEGREPTAYFSAERVVTRMERLSTFVTAPGVEDQVLRAWAKAAAEALERSGL